MDFETFVRDFLRNASEYRPAKRLLWSHGINPGVWRTGTDEECARAALLLRTLS